MRKVSEQHNQLQNKTIENIEQKRSANRKIHEKARRAAYGKNHQRSFATTESIDKVNIDCVPNAH